MKGIKANKKKSQNHKRKQKQNNYKIKITTQTNKKKKNETVNPNHTILKPKKILKPKAHNFETQTTVNLTHFETQTKVKPDPQFVFISSFLLLFSFVKTNYRTMNSNTKSGILTWVMMSRFSVRDQQTGRDT